MTRDRQTRVYKGDKEQWKTALQKHLGSDSALIMNCTRVAAPSGETRMVIECPSKVSRRQLYEGIRRHKGDIKCNISLSRTEYQNKQEVYCQANHHKLQVLDRGDMMTVINPRKTGLLHEHRIWLDKTIDQTR